MVAATYERKNLELVTKSEGAPLGFLIRTAKKDSEKFNM